MKIAAGNAWAQLSDTTREEHDWVDQITSVEVCRYRPGAWGKIKFDDRQRLLHILSGRFPTGLVPILLKANRALEVPFDITVTDHRGPAPCAPNPAADLAWLRPYQRDAVNAFVRKGRGIIKAPTASGKTEIIIGITRVFPCEWGMAVHRTDLVDQAAKRYHKRTGLTAGWWDGDTWHRGTGNLTVMTFQSMWTAIKRAEPAALELLHSLRGLLVDEVHAQAAESFYAVTMACELAYFRGGLSGTPLDRGDWDALKVQGALGPIIYEIPTETLVTAGLLSKPSIHMIPCVQTWPKTEHADWGPVYARLVVQSPVRNALLVEMAVRANKPCLMFVDHLDQGTELQTLLRARGLKVDFVHGKHWREARAKSIKHLVQGHTEVLLCSVIFQEGIDIPELESVVVGSGKASIVAALQRIGRGMRTAQGKSGFQVFDVADVGQRWLEKHAQERQAAYEREGHAVTLAWP